MLGLADARARRLPGRSWVVVTAALVMLSVTGCQSLGPDGRLAGEDLGPALDASLEAVADSADGEGARKKALAKQRTLLARHLPALLDDESAVSAGGLAGGVEEARRDPDAFARITPVTRPEVSEAGLLRDGIGLPAVGLIRPGGPNAPRAGFHVPLTLVAVPKAPPKECCDAGLFDPRRLTRVSTLHGELPVAMDLDAPVAATDSTGPRLGTALLNLVRPGAFQGEPDIVFLEPFDPAKIPVVLVHGLLSTPRTWAPLVRALLADKEFRDCCQIWFFYYPTGQPVPLSALQLREALDTAVAAHKPTKPLILVGHSMGGILSRAQISRITLEQAEEIIPGVAELPEDSLIRRALVFEPRPYIGRAVFMFAPHRGSRLASGGLASLGIRLIRLPSTLVDEVGAAARQLAGVSGERLPTSIHGLSPDSTFLGALDVTRPVVPVHSVIGDRGRGDRWAGSDGVVPYISAHLRFAESELVVPTGHSGFDHPRAVAELKRIIREEVALHVSTR